jgi:DNA-binding transcriptional regulator YdaS (Cro superfamily)
VNEEEVRRLLKGSCKELGSQKAFAAKHKISASYVSEAILGKRKLGPAILEALGLEVSSTVTMYRPAGE